MSARVESNHTGRTAGWIPAAGETILDDMVQRARGDSYLSGEEPAGEAGREQSGDAPAAPVEFVSRSAPGRRRPPPLVPLTCPDGSSLPSCKDRGLLALLLTVAVLAGFSWHILEGYQLADSVEYMERAQAFVRGDEVVDSEAIRSFGFIALLTPFFGLAELVGLEDLRPLVWCVRALQIILGMALVRISVRLGARLGGRTTGLVAGAVVALNPIFLQYTVSPVSGIAAGVCVGQALEQLLDRAGARRGLYGGLWLGAALLMAYQTILILAPLVLLILIRDRLTHLRPMAGILTGLAVGILTQVALDKLVYDAWGASLYRYFFENFGFLACRMVDMVGLHDLARVLYEAGITAMGEEYTYGGETYALVRQLKPPTWYITELPRMVVWPLIPLGALGVIRAVTGLTWRTSLLLGVFAANLIVMSLKGSKDFRLWLPLLPLIAPLCAWGWQACPGPGRPNTWPWRQALTAGLVLATAWYSLDLLTGRNTRKFGAYWEALAMVNELAPEEYARRALEIAEQPPAAVEGEALAEERPHVRVSSAYHWAIFMRANGYVDLIKLPHHLDHWDRYTDEERQEVFEALGELDWFITHLPVLENHPDLMAEVNSGFEVHAALYDHETFEDMGPVFLLRKRTGARDAMTLFDVSPSADPAAWRREHLLPPGMVFLGHDEAGTPEKLALLGWQYRNMPGDEHGWITYHWYAYTDLTSDYTAVDRLTTPPDERRSWQNNHALAYGVVPTSTWRAGTILRESYLVVAATDPFDVTQDYRPIGGAWRRGDLIPAHLWMDLARFDEEGEVIARLEPARAGEDRPVRAELGAGERRSWDGFEFSRDDLVQVGRLFLPVAASAWVPDDGRPIPD